MFTIETQFKGLEEVITIFNNAASSVSGAPMMGAMNRAIQPIRRDAAIGSPYDTGELRGSWATEVKTSAGIVEGIVGNPTAWAPFVEKGTEAPYRGYPPLSKIGGWAERHDWNPMWLAIHLRRRGTKPVRMLKKALDQNKSFVVDQIGQFVYSLFARSGKYTYPTTKG